MAGLIYSGNAALKKGIKGGSLWDKSLGDKFSCRKGCKRGLKSADLGGIRIDTACGGCYNRKVVNIYKGQLAKRVQQCLQLRFYTRIRKRRFDEKCIVYPS